MTARPHLSRFGSAIVDQHVAQLPPAAFGASVTHKPGAPGLVVAGFVLSFLVPILGLILSACGLPEARRRGAGETMAYFGIVASSFWILLALAFAIGLISRPTTWG
jgi:hypothetical protein